VVRSVLLQCRLDTEASSFFLLQLNPFHFFPFLAVLHLSYYEINLLIIPVINALLNLKMQVFVFLSIFIFIFVLSMCYL